MRRNRREFLGVGVSLAGAAMLGGLPWSKRAWSQGFAQERHISQGGLLDVAIEARQSVGELAGRRASISSFNGLVPGPVLDVRAGDTVRLLYTNSLSELTNLHYHGLHVDPNGFADNVFLELLPGESLQYEFKIPANHAAGTFWYHPHVHGFTARQLSAGMAAFLIVRGDLDEIPEVAAATEYLLMLKDYGVRGDGSVGPGPILTVSGRVNPTLSLPQDGMLRLRILNASVDLYYRLRLEEHPLHVIATDGGGIPEPVSVNELLVAPAERYEVLVRGERPPGSYRLLYSPYASVMPEMPGMPGMSNQPAPADVTLATVQYSGRAPRPLPLPSRLVRVNPLPPAHLLRTFEFRTRELPGGFVFQINGRDFDHHRVDTSVLLNTVEDWEVVNADQMDHPIHLHTNSFQVLGEDGEPERAWRDLMNVRGGARRRFRVRFEDFEGRMVYHCHRVFHGDLGMMGVLEIARLPFPPRSRIPRP